MLNSGTLVIPPQTLRVNPSMSFGLSPDVLAEGLWPPELGPAADHEPPPPSTPQAEAAAVAELTVSVVRGHTPIVA